MKISTFSNDTSLIIGDMQEKKFGIIANDKMFNILSSKIYNDKIKAPIRELATNAYDAHVACGKENIPFDVKLPTLNDCYFSIRDYGNGLNSTEIEELYTTYGWSDKNNSNKYTGCLGLGSKSPFAYTDSFEINSIKEGIKYIYKCYMELGIPHVMKFDEFPTDESSGLLIKFEVNKDDIETFHQKAKEVLEWFNVLPNIYNIDYPLQNNYKIEDNVILFYKKSGILMGNVLYEGFDFLWDYMKRNNIINDEIKSIRYNNVIVKANIGDYDISVSRESLSYCDKNGDKLYNFLIEYMKKSKEKFEKFINSLSGNNIEKFNKISEYEKNHIFINSNEWVNNNVKIDFSNHKSILIKGDNNKKGFHIIKLDKSIKFPDYIYNIDMYKVIYSDKIICKKNYKGYVIDNNVHIFLIDNKDILNKMIAMGIERINIDNYKPVNDMSYKEDGKLYIYGRNFNNKITCTLCTKTINKVLEEKKVLFYIPFYENKPDGNIPKKLRNDWIDCLQSFFNKHRIYITYRAETRKLKNRKNCYNVLEWLNNKYSNINDYKNVFKECKFDCINSIKDMLLNIKFNTNFMDDETKMLYKLFFDVEKRKYELIKNNYTKKEKIFISLFGSQIFDTKAYQLETYISNNYPLLSKWIDWRNLSDKDINNIRDYVEFIETKKENEK